MLRRSWREHYSSHAPNGELSAVPSSIVIDYDEVHHLRDVEDCAVLLRCPSSSVTGAIFSPAAPIMAFAAFLLSAIICSETLASQLSFFSIATVLLPPGVLFGG